MTSFEDRNARIQAAALQATKHSNGLPTQDLGFYKSMHSDYAQDLNMLSTRLINLTSRILNFTSKFTDEGKIKLSEEDVEDDFHTKIVDDMDHLLERADIALDDLLGRNKAPAIAVKNVPNYQPKINSSHHGQLDPALTHASQIRKPQLQFKTKTANHDLSPWIPTLKHKYNAQVPFGYVFHDSGNSEGTETVSNHPYQYEIMHTTYPSRIFERCTPLRPKSFEHTPLTWIKTPAQLACMIEKLRQATEVAIDLEYHNYRSFAGFVCLMQISTSAEDFIIDTLELREELEDLNEVFTDPCIVKIFHGAESDIVWLQQNFNLYIVNLFDTFHASRALDFPRHSLAHLMDLYCDYIPDKRYQLADWRIRPLPQELVDYARSDTHYLLYIYDNLRNSLLDRSQSTDSPPESFIRGVLQRSEETALRQYQKEIYEEDGMGPGGWDTMAKKWNKGALTRDAKDSIEKTLYRRLHAWRDHVARDEDESTRYVMTNSQLFAIADRPPKDAAALSSMFRSISPLLRKRVQEVIDLLGVAPDTEVVTLPVNHQSREISKVQEAELLQIPLLKPLSPLIQTTDKVMGVATSLFGSPQAFSTQPEFMSNHSTLFGSNIQHSYVPKTEISVIISRIHDDLSSVPNSIMDLPETSEEIPTTSTARASEPPELAYIAPSQRRQSSPIIDSVVLVGKARQKKRKRPREKHSNNSNIEPAPVLDASKTTSPNVGTRKKSIPADVVIEPFDYSTTKNLLDDVPLPELTDVPRKKKLKHQRGAAMQYGDFPAPPRARAEVKSGNVSHTFK